MALDDIRRHARTLGFADVGVAHLDLGEDLAHLDAYLEAGFHGEMDYLARNIELRASPAALQPGTVSVLSLRMPYLSDTVERAMDTLRDPERARNIHDRHLARARWMTTHGYRLLVREGQLH